MNTQSINKNIVTAIVKIFENLSEDKYSPNLINGKGNSIDTAILNALKKTNKKNTSIKILIII